MNASRLLTLLRAIAAVLFAVGLPAHAVGPPLWQPYRETFSPPQPEALAQGQYLVAQPPHGIPIEALTDAELDGLCCEPFTTYDTQFDPIIGRQLASPQSATGATYGSLELLPDGVIWHSYWAGAKEPRMSGTFFQETGDDISLLDVTLGGRSSLLRDAVRDNQGRWQGWELQLEGAAQLRLNLDQGWDFDSTDFRFGFPLIFARDNFHWKFGYHHLSSHVGDEFLVRNPGFMRVNYSRDVLALGTSYFPLPAWRWYAEAGWAFYDGEGSDPWEFQFGVDYAQPGPTGKRGTPFVAVNGHLRQELDYGGNLVAQAGWLWRGQTGRVLRTGLHYYNGKSSQFEFFNQFEQQIGFGIWHEY